MLKPVLFIAPDWPFVVAYTNQGVSTNRTVKIDQTIKLFSLLVKVSSFLGKNTRLFRDKMFFSVLTCGVKPLEVSEVNKSGENSKTQRIVHGSSAIKLITKEITFI